MFRRGQQQHLASQLDEHRKELQSLRREVAELGVANADVIELALISAVPDSLFRAITDARESGWTCSYRRRPDRPGHGTIDLEDPAGAAQSCSIELPLPDDPAARRLIESELRGRVGWRQAAA